MQNYVDLEKYPDVLNLNETSEFFRTSKDSIRKLCLSGEIKHIRIGKLYKFTKQNIKDFLEKK
ncbi:MAG: helix-turn-helix domain-containing protein [Fusobacteriaceae bacterium]